MSCVVKARFKIPNFRQVYIKHSGANLLKSQKINTSTAPLKLGSNFKTFLSGKIDKTSKIQWMAFYQPFLQGPLFCTVLFSEKEKKTLLHYEVQCIGAYLAILSNKEHPKMNILFFQIIFAENVIILRKKWSRQLQ